MGPLRLRQTELFGCLNGPEARRLEEELSVRECRAHEYLYFDSQPAEHFFIVRAGAIRTLRTSADGRVTAFEQLFPGELFGLAALRPEASYGESAQAVVESAVWRGRRRRLQDLLAAEPRLARSLLALLARRLEGAHDRLCSFAHDRVAARIARAVVERDDGERISVTRQALGEAAGTTVETAIRVLRGFERAGWIEGGTGWIRTLDRSALESVAEGKTGS